MIPTAGRKAALVGLLALVAVAADAQKVCEGYGWRPTAVPVVNFSSDDGTSFGIQVNLYEYDGEIVSHWRKYCAQSSATTGGKWVHRMLLDAPYIHSSERLEAERVFGDIGQIFARDSLPEGDAWRRGSGLGLCCRWHSTIVWADYGVPGAELFTSPSRSFSDI